MLIPKRRIDDFKAERKDLLPPLPTVLRLVPILFYCAIGMTALLAVVYVIQISIYQDKLKALTTGISQANTQINTSKQSRSTLESRILKATAVQRWVESSQPVQPLVVAITRSIQDGSNLINLRLDRDEEAPENLNLELRVGARSVEQLDDTITAISEQGYRGFSPQQSVAGTEIDYKSTLVKQLKKNSSGEIGKPGP